MFGRRKKKEDRKPKSAVDKIIMGAIVGTAVGSVIGLTVAPKKGEETRQFLKEQYQNRKQILEKGKDKLKANEEELKEIADLAKETVVGLGSLIKNMIRGSRKGETQTPESSKTPETQPSSNPETSASPSIPTTLRDHGQLRKIPNEMESMPSSQPEE